jgi:hypothetical protein
MAIRRRCKYRTCKNARRCLEHLQFDMKYEGFRYRVGVNDFAIPRMEPGRQRPIESIEEARDWERLFIGEVKAGRDPRRPPKRSMQARAELRTVAGFLDAYMERCVKPAGLRSIDSVRSRVGILKDHLGRLPLSALEDADEINRFKTESDYVEDVEIATVHRILETLRAAINWGMAQTPPLVNKSPFHRYGVRMNKKAETTRDRRIARDEEKRLLDAALQRMNTGEHRFMGPLLHDRIIGALELCCRRGGIVAKLRVENRGHGGKTVTIVDGLPQNEAFLKDLCQELKRGCGTGGTVIDSVVELQGDLRERD